MSRFSQTFWIAPGVMFVALPLVAWLESVARAVTGPGLVVVRLR